MIREGRSPSPAVIAVIVFVVLAALRLLIFDPGVESASRGTLQSVIVDRVIDGDTIVLSDNRHVRLLGIDAPELGRDGQPAQPYAEASRDWLRNQIEGHAAQLRLETRQTDRYGRTLAWVYSSDDALVNAQLLDAGCARLLDDYGLPADLEPALRAAEATARVNRRGLWAKSR